MNEHRRLELDRYLATVDEDLVISPYYSNGAKIRSSQDEVALIVETLKYNTNISSIDLDCKNVIYLLS